MKASELLRQSRRFERDEARADVYPMVSEWIARHDDVEERTRAVAAFLFIWNAAHYSYGRKGFKSATTSARGALSDPIIEELLENLRRTNLLKADLAVVGPAVSQAYEQARSHRGLGVAAASKTLHLLCPDLFVMWDRVIHEHYHQSHRSRGLRHERGWGACYVEFLGEMQAEAREATGPTGASALLEKLEELAVYAKPLTKALDEYNYMLYTIGGR